jgi:hypothetical protein
MREKIKESVCDQFNYCKDHLEVLIGQKTTESHAPSIQLNEAKSGTFLKTLRE